MRQIFIFFALIILSVSCFSQVTNVDIEIRKSAPTLKLNGSGSVINFYNGDLTLTQSSNTLTLGGGNFALGSGSLTMTGSLAATGSRVLKGWFTDLEVTNLPTINGGTLKTALSLTSSDVGLGNVTNKLQIEVEDSVNYPLGYMSRYDGVTGLAAKVNTADTAAMLDPYKLFPFDYYVYESSGTVYAVPHPKRYGTLEKSSDALLSTVLNDIIDRDSLKIYIAEGFYDEMDTVMVSYNYIQIEGAGQEKTILKLKDNFDASISRNYGLLQIRNPDQSYHTGNSVKNLTLNGNRTNQTKISWGGDDADDPEGVTQGILIYRNYNFVIENVHVVGFYQDGIETLESPAATILNCRVDSIGWNGITVNQKSVRNRVENCYVTHCGDVGIDIQASGCIVHNNRLREMDGMNGSGNTRVAIALENYGKNITISNNTIHGGDSTLTGIQSGARTPGSATNALIIGNNIDSTAVGIYMASDSSFILNNIITNYLTKSYWHDSINTSSTGIGIAVTSGDYNVVSNNLIRTPQSGLNGIRLHYSSTYYADYNTVTNNIIFNSSGLPGVYVTHASCLYNVIANNVMNGEYGADVDDQWVVYSPAAAPTSMIYNNLNRAGSTKAPDQVARNFKITAAADTSHANSKIDPGSQFITITSANADYCVRLPKALSYTIGTKVEGVVGANGFELRVPNSQLSTVYINGVTTNTEAAIPANTSFEIVQVDATHWILKAWDAEGSIIVGIVPDAI